MQQSNEYWAEILKFRVSIASVSLYGEPYLELSWKRWPLILLIQYLTSEIIISDIFDSRERKITSDSFAEFTNYNQQNKNTFRNFRIYIMFVVDFIPLYDDTIQLSMLLFWEKSFCIRKVVGRIGI